MPARSRPLAATAAAPSAMAGASGTSCAASLAASCATPASHPDAVKRAARLSSRLAALSNGSAGGRPAKGYGDGSGSAAQLRQRLPCCSRRDRRRRAAVGGRSTPDEAAANQRSSEEGEQRAAEARPLDGGGGGRRADGWRSGRPSRLLLRRGRRVGSSADFRWRRRRRLSACTGADTGRCGCRLGTGGSRSRCVRRRFAATPGGDARRRRGGLVPALARPRRHLRFSRVDQEFKNNSPS